MRRVRVFISSPSDVAFERRRVDRVAERLNGVFSDIVRFEIVRWERKFYTADRSFQPQIDRSVACDLVIAIFWSRLGSPLPDDFETMPNGEPYPSGSAYEILTAIDAYRADGRPDVYVFRKTEPPVHRIDRDDELDDAKAQLRNLRAFFERWFYTADGKFLAAFHPFATTDDFEDQVEALLRGWIDAHIPHSPTVAWPIETMGSPFRALLPFDARHAPVYFGRDRKVTRAIEQLKTVALGTRSAPGGPRSVAFLLIVGESGTGKSSLMRAGLAPRLTAPGAVAKIDLWRTAVMRIGDDADPFTTLAQALLINARTDIGGFGAALPELADIIPGGAEALAALLAGHPRHASHAIIRVLVGIGRAAKAAEGYQQRQRANLLLLVDQFENLFGAGITDERRATFARLLSVLAHTRRIWVVATLRADLYGRMSRRGEFIELKDAGAQYDLAAPGESELSEIVHQSAVTTGLVFEIDPVTAERLDERILQDAKGDNMLPLLEFTLDRLFQDRKTVNGETRLTWAAYRDMGGVDGAIDQTAERALRSLDDSEIKALPRLLRALAAPVRDKKNNRGGAGELAVQTVPRRDAAPDDATRGLVDALIDARIVVATGSDTDDGGLIGIVHQHVFESWKRARDLVDADSNFFRIRDEIETARLRWDTRGHSDELLLPKGVPLAEAEQILRSHGDELSETIHSFVAASSRRAQRNQRRLAIAAASFAVLFLVATATGGTAYFAKREAERNYNAAKQTVDNLVSKIADGLENLTGMTVKTMNAMLIVASDAIGKLQTASLGDPDLDRIRAAMLYRFAKTYQKLQSHSDAVTTAQQSLMLRQALTGYDRPANRDPARFGALHPPLRWELSESLELVGDLEREEQHVAAARARFNQVLAIRSQLAAQFPDSNDWAYGLSLIHVRLGDLDMKTDLAAANRHYQEALAQAAGMFKRTPENVSAQRELSWDFNKVGDVRKAIGEKFIRSDMDAARPELKAALDAFNNSLCIRRQLDQREGNNNRLRRDISFTLERIAQIEIETGDSAGAENVNYEALTIRRQLLLSDRDNALYQSDVAASLEQIGAMYLARHAQNITSSITSSISPGGDRTLSLAAAFHEAAADALLQLELIDPKAPGIHARLVALRSRMTAAFAPSSQNGDLAPMAGTEWRARVTAAEADAAKRFTAVKRDDGDCWAAVRAAIDDGSQSVSASVAPGK